MGTTPPLLLKTLSTKHILFQSRSVRIPAEKGGFTSISFPPRPRTVVCLISMSIPTANKEPLPK